MKKVNVYSIAISEDYTAVGVYPLALLIAYARSWKAGSLNDHFELHPVDMYIMADLDKILALANRDEPAIFLFSSYTWVYEAINVVAKCVREKCPDALIVVGGPMVPKDSLSMMNELHDYDVAVFGEGEQTFVEMLENITHQSLTQGKPMRFTDHSGIQGLQWRKSDMSTVRNEPRTRIADVNIIPSPYLNNIVLNAKKANVIFTETNRGCPFGCTFCDWGGNTMTKFRIFDMERVLEEIEWAGKNDIDNIFITDSNFGSFKRDIDIVHHLVATKKKYGSPKNIVASFAKNVTDRVADILEILYHNGMTDRATIAFQTTDQQTLNNIDRGNIKTSRFDDLVVRLKHSKVPILTELIIGLPGQSYTTFKHDMQYFFDRVAFPMVYELVVLPNAPMAEKAYLEKFSIKLDENLVVIETMSFDAAERLKMIELRLVSQIMLQEKFILYFLYYFQAHYQLKAFDIIEEMITHAHTDDDTYPKIKWLVNNMSNRDMSTPHKSVFLVQWYADAEYVLADIADFYREFIAFMADKFNVVGDPDEIDTLLKLQMLTTDRVNKSYPIDCPVAHDVIGYFSQFTAMANIHDPDALKNIRPLKSFPEAVLQAPANTKKKRQYSLTKINHVPDWPAPVVNMPF